MTVVKIMLEEVPGVCQATATDSEGQLAVCRAKTKVKAMNAVKTRVAEMIDGPFEWEVSDLSDSTGED